MIALRLACTPMAQFVQVRQHLSGDSEVFRQLRR
jgi:hypothetical protein